MLLLAATPGGALGMLTCHAISAVATDAWCDQNCNTHPYQCPPVAQGLAGVCECEAAPAPAPSPPGAETIGYYSPVWAGSEGLANATLGIAFSGWVLPSQAVGYTGPPLKGAQYVSLGGGNANGKFHASGLQAIVEGISDGTFKSAGYDGICFDVEECDAGLAPAFAAAFAAAKEKGLRVFVTTSHSAPYGCPDGAALVEAWLADENLDFVSPQLYTSGRESEPEFTPNDQVPWSTWRGSKVKIVPSIVRASQYAAVQSWAEEQGLPALGGFLQWASDTNALV